MNATTAELVEITDADRDEAARWAKPHAPKFWAARGVYLVTVGGYIVGRAERHALATSKTATWWSIADADGNRLDGAFSTRRDAADALARTDAGVDAYRAGARDGAFGTAAEATEWARTEALIAADEAEGAPVSASRPRPAGERVAELYADEPVQGPEDDDERPDPHAVWPGAPRPQVVPGQRRVGDIVTRLALSARSEVRTEATENGVWLGLTEHSGTEALTFLTRRQVDELAALVDTARANHLGLARRARG